MFPMQAYTDAFLSTGEDVVIFNNNYRYVGFRGGRARGASWTIAEGLVRITREYTCRVLCVREIQRSIKTSVHRLLRDTINRLDLESEFYVTDNEIRHRETGSEFIFSGLWGQEQTIRSTEGVDICYIEEAQSTSKKSLEALFPTVLRSDSSIIVFAMNPDQEDDPIEEVCKYPNALILESNYLDNENCPAAIIEEAERCKKYDPETYNHVWLGDFNKKSNEIVFGGKVVQEYIPPNAEQKYYGVDYGYGGDPTVFVVTSLQGDDVLIHEAKFWYDADPDIIADYLEEYGNTEGFDNRVYGDSADQGSSKIVKKRGVPMVSKWGKDKIEDGVRWLRSHRRIVINTGLDEMFEEAQKYKYKVDPKTGDIMPVAIDKFNHGWDAVRYSFHRLIKRGIV